MYTTQTEMTFSKTDLDKENFAKGKNEGKLHSIPQGHWKQF